MTKRDASRPLPTRIYRRGDQGTFIYAPDISVYVDTDRHGVVDLSQYITNFTLQRNPNNVSTFSCSFDNKYARFDRVLRRMNRIVVFLKRVQWVQAFAGYITVAPWETVVPGDAMIMAECTLKRLHHIYWDPHSAEYISLFPYGNQAQSSKTADGGAAASMFKLLTIVGEWDQQNIQIQKIPLKWMDQALKILVKSKDDDLNDPQYQNVKEAIKKLLDADGWLGYGDISSLFEDVGATKALQKWNSKAGLVTRPIDAEWQALTGKKDVEPFPPGVNALTYSSGFDSVKDRLVPSGVYDSSNRQVLLRPDAAVSFKALYSQLTKEVRTFDDLVRVSYLSYDEQKSRIVQALRRHDKSIVSACAEEPCPAGISEHGWGTAIDFEPGISVSTETMNSFGWVNDPTGDGGTGNPSHWVFVGNYSQGYPAYIRASENPNNARGQIPRSVAASTQFDWDKYNADQSTNDESSVTKTYFYWPGYDPMSDALTGKRAWINDVPLIQGITDLAAASMRDFQSAPNGDFIAYFPDRLGIYGKFPTMQIRDIEVVDFKISVSDAQMVTHYVSVGDFTNVEPHTGTDWDVFLLAGYVTVEQDDVMRLLMGLTEEETPEGLGSFMMQRFGIRPRRDDNYNIRDSGYNYMIALHRFQEAWAAQWQALVTFSYLPELFPGMRIELVDHGLAVYVESVSHQGSRTGGFSTQAMVSTPMRRSRNGDTWVLQRPEFMTEAQAAATSRVVEDVGETIPIGSDAGYVLPGGKVLPGVLE